MARRELRSRATGVRVLLQHLIITGALTLALCLLLLGGAGSERAYALEEEPYRPGQVVVKINTDVTTIVEFNDSNDTTTLDDYFASDGIYLLEVPSSWTGSALEFADKLKNENDLSVIYAQPNFLAEAPEDPASDGRMKARSISSTSESTDGSPDRRAARNLGLSCAAKRSQGKGSTVAVLDTGAQLKHPALQDNFKRDKGFLGYDFVGDDTNPSEPRIEGGVVGHGTHVAGIVARVAPEAKIMPLRVLNAKGVGDVFTIAKAVSYAQRHGAHAINLSLGSSNRSETLQEIIGKAIDKGVVVVAAAGNSNNEKPHYPAAGNRGVNLEEPLSRPSTAGLLAVTSLDSSIDRDGKRSWFANFGTWVTIAAPGQKIRSAFPPDQYANWSGTSMATPFVSGQAALIRTVDDSLDPAGIKKRIRDSAREENLFEEPGLFSPPQTGRRPSGRVRESQAIPGRLDEG
ncbi:MAG: S8 family serine peptidase [Rubrobacteraceae bacterium]|nr:S8 family serine peptidase [Rubrobacteraceae bacterium]